MTVGWGRTEALLPAEGQACWQHGLVAETAAAAADVVIVVTVAAAAGCVAGCLPLMLVGGCLGGVLAFVLLLEGDPAGGYVKQHRVDVVY